MKFITTFILFSVQFLGIWYAVQKTSTASTCVVYNISRGEEPGEYSIAQTSQHFALGLTPLKHEYSYTGQITIPDDTVPAKMSVNFPLSKLFNNYYDMNIYVTHQLVKMTHSQAHE